MKLSTFVKSTFMTTALVASSLTFAANIEVNANSNDIAISGYDTVSYFTKGTPTKGSNNFTAAYNGAIYQFSSADNRDLFKADPSKYAPQYGGFCAMGVALNKKLYRYRPNCLAYSWRQIVPELQQGCSEKMEHRYSWLYRNSAS
ncbi:YHS domain-containing (seleno)protein [Moritella sp.]|uniref:YHS domain-containing (seleno)protein n=1 Tax=Moritella sp. TaxID=78556 RepID=UPI0025FABA67|nr:YHS domain-containing (seleno)protein [Moritella sp.]